MKILLVHNFYGSAAPSGENQVFEAEKVMLEEHGETVEVYTRYSDEIRVAEVKVEGQGESRWGSLSIRLRKVYGMVKGAMCTVGNPWAARALAREIAAFKPEVVHFHNQFPLISPLAVRAAHRSGARVVMTLHNYRLVCAAGIPMRGGKVCRDCFACGAQGAARPTIRPALRYRCYRGSLLATLPLAINIWLYRHCWAKWVDRLVVLSEFQKRVMVECGFPEERLVVKGNFIRSSTAGVNAKKKNQVLFVGRLSDEKGVKTLLRAWEALGPVRGEPTGETPVAPVRGEPTGETPVAPVRGLVEGFRLMVVGDGVKRGEYERLAEGLSVEFLGQREHAEVLRLMAESKATVLPSEWWETFGLTVVESMSVGTPVVVSDLGALPDIVGDCGEVFHAGDAAALAAALHRLLSRADYAAICAACLHRVATHYTAVSNYHLLSQIYKL